MNIVGFLDPSKPHFAFQRDSVAITLIRRNDIMLRQNAFHEDSQKNQAKENERIIISHHINSTNAIILLVLLDKPATNANSTVDVSRLLYNK